MSTSDRQPIQHHASLEQLQQLVDSSPVGMFLTDSDNRFIFVNPRWSEITGLSLEETIGRLRSEVIETQHRHGQLADLPTNSIDESEMLFRSEISVPGSPFRTIQVRSKSIPGPGGRPAGWVGTMADVTIEARAEAAMSDARDKAAEASRLKSDFLANISHEIRTPMNGIIGMTDLLLETDLDPGQREFAQSVRGSGDALLSIVDEILDFARLEVGKVAIESSRFNVRTVVDDAVMPLAGEAEDKGLELVVALGNSIPAVVIGDPRRLRQVLTNLIGNAIKFTQIGEVVIRVSSTTSRGEAIVRFEISDTGDGIAPEKVAVIFDPFVQADSSISRKYGGAGLGLSISNELVSLMGGECKVSSSLGVGSTFVFTIRALVEAAALGPASPCTELVGVTVLIVDDSPSQRDVLSEQLTEWGMSVRTAETGNAAIEMLRDAATHGCPFDVALIDQLMPEMDGLEVTKAVTHDPTLDTRLILMTRLSHEEDATRLESGVSALLCKPIRRDNLMGSLLTALDMVGTQDLSTDVGRPRRVLSAEPESARLLLVEDNVINQKVAAAMLSNAGYAVDTVGDGNQAVEAVRNERYDAILMDCQMPGMNGFQATAAIRALEGAARHTPIIALTAGARPDDRERCFSEGMDGYLPKPLDRETLVALVTQFVRN